MARERSVTRKTRGERGRTGGVSVGSPVTDLGSMKVVGRVRLTRQRHVRFGQHERVSDLQLCTCYKPGETSAEFSSQPRGSCFDLPCQSEWRALAGQLSRLAVHTRNGSCTTSQAPVLLFEPTSTTAASMTHPGQPSTSSATSEALDTALDLTVEGLDAAKDTIVDALSVPGIGVALDAAIGILKKIQVCGLVILLCSSVDCI